MRNIPNYLKSIFIAVITIYLISASSLGEAFPGNIIRGGMLYDNWLDVLKLPSPTILQPLWSGEENSIDIGDTWRCVACHGWDYEGGPGLGKNPDSGFPSLINSQELGEAEIEAWLDGTNNTRHDFSSFLTVEASRDITAFLQYGVIENSILMNESGNIEGSKTIGERLYKNSCLECHGSDGSKLNFATAEKPVFIGNVAAENPLRIHHLVRFGHIELQVGKSGKLGFDLDQVTNLVAYTQQLPNSEGIFENGGREGLDYSFQGDTKPIIVTIFVIGIIIFSAVVLVSVRENRQH